MGYSFEKAAPGYRLVYNSHRRVWMLREERSNLCRFFHGDEAKQRAIALSVKLVRSGQTLADVEDE